MIGLILLLILAIVVLINWIRIVAWVTQKRMELRHCLTGIKLSVLEFLDDLGLL